MKHFDLGKFKKSHEDMKHATLVHPDGHQIKIAKASLNAKMKGELANLQMMAEGGEIEETGPSQEMMGPPTEKTMQAQQSQVQQLDPNSPSQTPVPSERSQPVDNRSILDKIANIVYGGGQPTPAMQEMNSHQAPADPNTPAAPKAPLQGYDFSKGRSPSEVPPSPAPTQIPGMNPMAEMQAGVNQQMKGIKGEAEAQSQLGHDKAKILQDGTNGLDLLMKKHTENYDKLLNEGMKTLHDMGNGHIDPSHYTNSMSSLGKVSTAIGLLLSGISGSGASAAKWLDTQIDRDIEGQKASFNNKNNLLTAFQHQLGSMKDGEEMYRAVLLGKQANQIEAAAANSSSPMAKYIGDQKVGELRKQAAMTLAPLALNQTMNQMAQQGADMSKMLPMLRIRNPEMAKEIETRYVPGVGMANVPVPEAVRSKIIAGEDVNNKLQEIRSWAKDHSGTLNPSERAYGKTKALELQSAIRVATGQGVYKESEAEYMSKMLGDDPAGFFNKASVDPKYKAMQDSNLESLNLLKKSYDLPQKQNTKALSKPKGY